MLWINFLHLYQPANLEAYKIKEAADMSYKRIFKALLNSPNAKFTVNVSGCLINSLIDLKYYDIIEDINSLVESSRLELVSSAAYHPLLPLVSEDEALWQIEENQRIVKKYIPKADLKGFFLPEMAYGVNVAKLIKSLGYEWLILDEISFDKENSKTSFNPSAVYEDKNSKLLTVFRSRIHSNSYVPLTVKDLLNKDDQVLITATDAELYGLRYIDHDKNLEKILNHDKLETMCVSDYISKFKKDSKLEEIVVRPSSWESTEKSLRKQGPYHLWFDKKNKVHVHLWEFVNIVYKNFKKYQDDKNSYWARWHLSRGLASCAFWWASANDFKASFGPIAWSPDEIEKGVSELIRSFRSLESSTSRDEKIAAEEAFLKIKKIIWAKHWLQYYQDK